MTVGIVHEVRMASRVTGSPAVRLSDTASGGASQAHLTAQKRHREKSVVEGLKVAPLMGDEEFDIQVALELAWHKEREQFERDRAERERINAESAEAWRQKQLRDRGDSDS